MQDENATRTNKSRTHATTNALLDAARKLFAEKGYADTSTPEIVRAAGVTRGALYHHFEDKQALFREVITREYNAVAAEIMASAVQSPGSAVEALQMGSRGFLKAMNDEGRLRIILLDGPAVLPRAELDAIEAQTSSATLKDGLAAAMKSGEIAQLPIGPLTTQMSALFDRAALAVSQGQDAEEHLSVLDALFASLARK